MSKFVLKHIAMGCAAKVFRAEGIKPTDEQFARAWQLIAAAIMQGVEVKK